MSLTEEKSFQEELDQREVVWLRRGVPQERGSMESCTWKVIEGNEERFRTGILQRTEGLMGYSGTQDEMRMGGLVNGFEDKAKTFSLTSAR